MLTLTEIFAIIGIHWIADFVLQAEKWALGKSKNRDDLLAHTSLYSLVWFIPISILLKSANWEAAAFVSVTFIAHTATDYVTSRIVSKKFSRQEYGSPIPNFGAFTIIGIDQVLHYVQLFTTYYLLK